MTAGGGDLEGSPCVRLAADIGQVGLRGRHRPGVRWAGFGQSLAATQVAGDGQQMIDRVQRQSTNQRCLFQVVGRHDQPRALLAARQRQRQDAGNLAHRTSEAEFPDQLVAVGCLRRQLATRDQDADRDCQVETAALLGEIGGCEVDRYAPGRELETAVDQGTAHPVAAFLHGLFRQADDVERRQAIGEMGFDRDRGGRDPHCGTAQRACVCHDLPWSLVARARRAGVGLLPGCCLQRGEPVLE